MSSGEFATAIVLGILSVILPLLIVAAIVAACVYMARLWIDRKG